MTATEFDLLAEPLRRCAKCQEEKPRDSFVQGYCGPCNRAVKRERYAKNREVYADRIYAKSIMRLYGLTMDQYGAMVEAQGGRCGLCGQVPQHRMNVDHDHETGAVRELLCSRCNTLLALAGDSTDVLEKATGYLHRHR